MRRTGVTCIALLLTTFVAAGLAPTTAGTSAAATRPTDARAAPDEAAVRAGCHGSSGRISLTVSPPDAEGQLPFRIEGRHLPDGSRWSVAMLAEESRSGQEESVETRRVARAGSWTYTDTIDVSALDNRLFYGGFAYRLDGGDPGDCTAAFLDARPPVARGSSRFSFLQRLALARDADGGFRLSYVQDGHPGDRWDIEVRAMTGEGTAASGFEDTVGPQGRLRFRLDMGPISSPRLLVIATNADGHKVVLGLDAPACRSSLPLNGRC